jgi:hypothetical protein
VNPHLDGVVREQTLQVVVRKEGNNDAGAAAFALADALNNTLVEL